MKISETIERASEILKEAGVAEHRREAASLLAFSLKTNRTYLIANSNEALGEIDRANYFSLVARRANREPFQHITGIQEFYALDFIVSKDVLIPRPETELIVEHALKIFENRNDPHFCEIGVGSGCISISILKNKPTAKATALDISANALKIAALNAENHGVSSRLELLRSDIFSAIEERRPVFDLIVSNPPYISRADFDELQPEVRDFDPRLALTDEGDGLSIIRSIAGAAPGFLDHGGYLLMEIGFGQSELIGECFRDDVWSEFQIIPDLQDIPRMIKARKR